MWANRVVVEVSLKEGLKSKLSELFDELLDFEQEIILEDSRDIDEYIEQYRSHYLIDWKPYMRSELWDRPAGVGTGVTRDEGYSYMDRQRDMKKSMEPYFKEIFRNEMKKIFIFADNFSDYFQNRDLKNWNKFEKHLNCRFYDLNFDFSEKSFEQKTK